MEGGQGQGDGDGDGRGGGGGAVETVLIFKVIFLKCWLYRLFICELSIERNF